MNARGVRKIVDESIAIKQTYIRDCRALTGKYYLYDGFKYLTSRSASR
jgi:hypothetical protein